MRILIIMSALFLGSCSWFHNTEEVKPTVVVTQKMIYPKIPDIRAPIKSKLEDVKFDWPRESNYYSVKNSKKCKLGFLKIHPKETPLTFKLKIDDAGNELEQYGEFWYNCGVQSIDLNSNLYIGLTEMEYKKLVNNMSSLMMREKKWKALLKSINGTLSEWRKKGEEKLK